MIITHQAPTDQNIHLDRILENSVVSNWKDLVPADSPGAIQIEYHVGPDGSVNGLKMWCANARGYSSLVCDYSVNPGWSNGPRFSNGFHSRDMGRQLESIMMNQNLFRTGAEPNRNVVLQVSSPTPEAIAMAQAQMNETFPQPVNIPRKTAPRRLPDLAPAIL